MAVNNAASAAADAATNDFAATVVSLPPSAVDLPLGGPDSAQSAFSALDSVPADAGPSQPGAPLPGCDSGPGPTGHIGHIGRYELQQVLGSGGLGAVYEARDPLLSRTVAIKTLQFDAAPGARVALDRLFLNEARAAAGLSHPHIVTVFDAGLSAHGVYIAMERLRGRDLRQALAEGWRPSPAQAVLLARRVADALAYAHARGVVHCDIKPANIFLGRSGKPKLLDFGIARIVRRVPAGGADGARDPEGTGLPGLLDGMVAGSPHYLAPEQLRGEAVDGRTDVYALGVVLYELLTGRKAFVGDSVEAIHEAVLQHVVPPASAIDASLPPALALLVARAMARDPAERPADAAEFAQALRPWHEGLEAEAAQVADRTPRAGADGAAAPASAASAPAPADGANSVAAPAAHPSGPSPRRRRAAGLLAGTLLALVGVVGALALLAPAGDQAPTSPRVQSRATADPAATDPAAPAPATTVATVAPAGATTAPRPRRPSARPPVSCGWRSSPAARSRSTATRSARSARAAR
jgi:eukaryotic-like serine/threonine-protein kinase